MRFARSLAVRIPTLDALGVEQVRGDLADAAAVAAAAAGCDVVFHVAAKAGVWGPWDEYYQANVVGTDNVIAACRRAPAFGSSCSPVRPASPLPASIKNGVDESEPYPDRYLAHYPHTKALAEQAVLAQTGRSWRRFRFDRT